jgi:hypothetical protein
VFLLPYYDIVGICRPVAPPKTAFGSKEKEGERKKKRKNEQRTKQMILLIKTATVFTTKTKLVTVGPVATVFIDLTADSDDDDRR